MSTESERDGPMAKENDAQRPCVLHSQQATAMLEKLRDTLRRAIENEPSAHDTQNEPRAHGARRPPAKEGRQRQGSRQRR